MILIRLLDPKRLKENLRGLDQRALAHIGEAPAYGVKNPPDEAPHPSAIERTGCKDIWCKQLG